MSVFDPLRAVSCAIAVALIAASVAVPARADDKITAASLGGRVVELLWVPEDRSWPAGGWRLERVAGSGAPAVVAARIEPGSDRAAMAKLKPEEARGVLSFAEKLKRGTLTDQEREAADIIYVIAAVTKPDYGRALGLRYRDARAPAGTVRYRLVALDAEGKTIRTAESKPLDPAQRTPLPRPPENASLDFAGEGLAISWNEPSVVEAAPVVGYRVLRIENNRPTNLTPELLLRGKNTGTPRVNFFDREAPRDRAFTYVLTSIDLFGRSSAPSRIEVPLDRLARAIAPTGLAATPGEESAALTWDAVTHPGVRGYALERSLFVGGPYEVVTRDGLPAGTLAYADGNLRGATTYYYRVRVFDAGGELGVPSLPVRVVPLSSIRAGRPNRAQGRGGQDASRTFLGRGAIAGRRLLHLPQAREREGVETAQRRRHARGALSRPVRAGRLWRGDLPLPRPGHRPRQSRGCVRRAGARVVRCRRGSRPAAHHRGFGRGGRRPSRLRVGGAEKQRALPASAA